MTPCVSSSRGSLTFNNGSSPLVFCIIIAISIRRPSPLGSLLSTARRCAGSKILDLDLLLLLPAIMSGGLL